MFEGTKNSINQINSIFIIRMPHFPHLHIIKFLDLNCLYLVSTQLNCNTTVTHNYYPLGYILKISLLS